MNYEYESVGCQQEMQMLKGGAPIIGFAIGIMIISTVASMVLLFALPAWAWWVVYRRIKGNPVNIDVVAPPGSTGGGNGPGAIQSRAPLPVQPV